MPDTPFERRLRAALHAPVATDPSARDHIMARVRATDQGGQPEFSARGQRPRPRRSIGGLVLAAGIASIAVVGSPGGVAPAARSIARVAAASAIVHDTVGSALLDTMRLVQQWSGGRGQLALERRYAIVVDMTRFVPAPVTVRLHGDDGRIYSLLHPPRVSD